MPYPQRLLRILIVAQQVRNIQAKLREQRYGPCTATKVLIDMLERYKESHNIEYFVDWVGDENVTTRRITRVFWTYKWSIEL